MKACTRCGAVKPSDDFFRSSSTKDGLTCWCKVCRKEAVKAYRKTSKGKAARSSIVKRSYQRVGRVTRRVWALRNLYGLSQQGYDSLLSSQGGRCAICEEQLVKPHVDHCHRTGKVRGLLCDRCNRGMGFFRDNPVILDRASVYLKGEAF